MESGVMVGETFDRGVVTARLDSVSTTLEQQHTTT
jgi:hypothetical protein